MHGRKFALTAAVTTLASTLVLCGPALVANADPTAAAQPAAQVNTVSEAQAELARLDADGSRLEEAYAQAKLALEASQQRAGALAADVEAQEAKVAGLRKQAAEFARASFQSSGIDTTTQLFVSGDPDSFLQQISTVAKVDENMNSVMQQFQAEEANLTDLRRAADLEVTKATESEKKMSELTEESQRNVAAATATLSRLSSADRAALTGEAAVSATSLSLSVSAPSAAAAQAVAYAEAHVGSAYVWGAEGPSSFDCSGLMLAAYRSAGVSLPHSSSAQSGYGRAVSQSDLQPGDLIFWYSPIHHVAMYVGNGMMVHATNPRAGVIKNPVSQWLGWGVPYSGARRIAG